MDQSQPSRERKSADRQAFEFFIRKGRRLPTHLFRLPQRKFNPNHDPENGQFTSGSAGVNTTSETAQGLAPTQPHTEPTLTAPKPARPVSPSDHPDLPFQGKVGVLSEKYESNGRGPGTVSGGAGDPGGVSYGTHQLSSKQGTADEFIASPEAAVWAEEFSDLKAGTDEFSAKWKEVAVRDPEAFEEAQLAFMVRTKYDPVLSKVVAESDFDLHAASPAMQQVTFSTTIQHGQAGGAKILNNAIATVDGKLERDDPSYQSTLINEIYDRRTTKLNTLISYYEKQAEKFKAAKDPAKELDARKSAQIFRNIVEKRFPKERADALWLLQGGAGD